MGPTATRYARVRVKRWAVYAQAKNKGSYLQEARPVLTGLVVAICGCPLDRGDAGLVVLRLRLIARDRWGSPIAVVVL